MDDGSFLESSRPKYKPTIWEDSPPPDELKWLKILVAVVVGCLFFWVLVIVKIIERMIKYGD